MKFILCLALLSGIANANTITIKSSDENPRLSVIPQDLAATFVYQGFKQIQVSKNVFQVKIDNLTCKYNSMDFYYPDDKRAGLPMINCFVGNKKIQEGRNLEKIFSTIEAEKSDFFITDCSLGGKCIASLKSIKCTSDLNQEEMHKAYSCELTNEY